MAFKSRFFIALWTLCFAAFMSSSWMLFTVHSQAAAVCITSAGLVLAAALCLLGKTARHPREVSSYQELSALEAGERVPFESAASRGISGVPVLHDDEPARAQVIPAASSEVHVQCSFDEMLLPMRPSPFGQRMAIRRIMESKLHREDALSVTTVLSRFDSAPCVRQWVRTLDEAQLAALADRFFGSHVAGKSVLRRSRCSVRRVPARVVDIVVAMAQFREFRQALFVAATRLFLGGIPEEPFYGRGLVTLAIDRPERFRPLCAAACELLAALVRHHVLPKALAVEISRAAVDVPNLATGSFLSPAEPPLVIYKLLLAAISPLCRTEPTDVLENAAFVPRLRCRRTLGTNLHMQPELQPYSSVSVAGVEEVIPAQLDAEHVASYWLFVAGGEHSAGELEKRAREAAGTRS